MSEKCEFDKEGICYATVCYSSQKCGARDKNGSPKYSDNNEKATSLRKGVAKLIYPSVEPYVVADQILAYARPLIEAEMKYPPE